MNQSYGIDKGIYGFDTINKFDEIKTFTGERKLILLTFKQNVRKNGSKETKIVDGQI